MTQADTLSSRLDALEKLAKAATPGPWWHYRNKLRPNFGGIINEVQCRGKCPIVKWSGFDDSDRSEKKHSANAAYIAAANPSAILALIGEVRELLGKETK